MFTRPTQHLAIRSPSFTTVSYTVSTASPETKPYRLLWNLRIAIRVFFCTNVLLIDLATLESVLPRRFQIWHLGNLSLHFHQRIAEHAAIVVDWRLVALLSFFILYLCNRRRHTEESLLVLQGLGIQTTTSSPYFFSSSTTTFIPTTQIQDIVIHEAFKGLEVRFYLAVIVEGAPEVVVVFPVCTISICNLSAECANRPLSVFYQNVRSLKKSGGALESACMMASAETSTK